MVFSTTVTPALSRTMVPELSPGAQASRASNAAGSEERRISESMQEEYAPASPEGSVIGIKRKWGQTAQSLGTPKDCGV